MASSPLKSLGLALQQSLSPNPAERRQAERTLDEFKRQPGFCHLALQLAQNDKYEDGTPTSPPIRQASALLFKNYIRFGWVLVSENEWTQEARVCLRLCFGVVDGKQGTARNAVTMGRSGQ
jgi:exportin-2 (importin alpha re-exporter)